MVEASEEEEWRAERETHCVEEENGDLDPEQTDKVGRRRRSSLGIFEFGSWEEPKLKTGKAPTTTKWIDRVKKVDDSREFVRCRLVARDFEPRREGPRDDLSAAMPPLETQKALFAYVAGVREKRREQGQDEVKLVFIALTVKKAHLDAKCEEKSGSSCQMRSRNLGRVPS